MEPDINAIVAGLIASLVTGAVAWVVGKVRGKNVPTWRVMLEAAFDHELVESIDQHLSAAATRFKLEDAAWVVLARAKAPKNAITKALVAEAVELGVAEFRRRLRNRAIENAAKALPGKLDELHRATQGVAEAFESPKQPVSPTTEIIDRTGDESWSKPFKKAP